MVLDTWMLVVSVLAFGICAVYNRYRGFRAGRVAGMSYAVDALKTAGIIHWDGKTFSPGLRRENGE